LKTSVGITMKLADKPPYPNITVARYTPWLCFTAVVMKSMVKSWIATTNTNTDLNENLSCRMPHMILNKPLQILPIETTRVRKWSSKVVNSMGMVLATCDM